MLDDGGIEHLAARVGVTSRHLRRIFETQYGVSPIEYAQTQRLLLAKRLLTDTALPVTEVALASGFASVRRFNALFRARYRMAPGAAAHATPTARALPATLAFELAFRPPYDWEAMLDFLRARAIAGVEDVTADAYARSVAIAHRGAVHTGRIEVRRARRKQRARDRRVAVARPRRAGRAVAGQARVRPRVRSRRGRRRAGRARRRRIPACACRGRSTASSLRCARSSASRSRCAARERVLGRIAAAFGEPLPERTARLTRLFPTAARLAACRPRRIAAARR